MPFLRHHSVTRIDSLHRLPLLAAWSASVLRHLSAAEASKLKVGSEYFIGIRR